MHSYSSLTEEQKKQIEDQFRYQLSMGNKDARHIAGCIAHDVFCRRKTDKATNRAWNSKVGIDAYATVLTYLVHNKLIEVIVK